MAGANISADELSNRIEALDKKGLHRKALAKRLGVSDRAIRKWQTGETKISIAALRLFQLIEQEHQNTPEQEKRRSGRPSNEFYCTTSQYK
jgi:DNA-binding transcriptional regulator YiaG